MAVFKGLFQHPELLRTEVILEQFQNGAGRPGLVPAVQVGRSMWVSGLAKASSITIHMSCG